MKRFIYFALLVVLFASCNKNEVEQNPILEGNYKFVGTVVVVGGNINMETHEVSDFIKENVYVKPEQQEDGTYRLLLEEVNFSNMMPVNINMALPGVVIKNAKLSLGAAETVNPLIVTPMGEVADENYVVKNFSGSVTYKDNGVFNEISLDFVVAMKRMDKVTEYPTSYKGVYQEVK